MIKVLHLIESLAAGGKERQLVEFLKYNSPNINSQVVIFKDKNHYPDSIGLNVKIHILKRKIRKDFSVFFKLAKIIKEYNPDIIQSWGSMPSIYAIPFVIFSKRVFVNMMIRNAICKFFSSNWIRSRLTYHFSDVVLANSYAGLENYKAPLQKSSVVYNGIHLTRFENLPEKMTIKENLKINTKYIVGMVGAFHPRKDYNTFLKAAISILKSRTDITFITIGEGSGLDKFKDSIPKIMNENIRCIGRITNVEYYLKIFDIGVLMTNPNVHREGISNAIIEYMASKIPVIASFGGGTPEIVDNNINGFIIQPFNSLSLENKIIYLLDNEEIRKSFGENGANKIQNGFTIKTMMNSFEEIYKENLKGLLSKKKN